MALSVLESGVRSRAGPPGDSADLLLITPQLVAVVSGVGFAPSPGTAQAARVHGLPVARFAAEVGLAGLRGLDPRLSLHAATDHLSAELRVALERTELAGVRLNVGYAFAAVHNARREVWQVGAVAACVGGGLELSGERGEERVNLLPSLAAVGQARALILGALLAGAGASAAAQEALRANDPAAPLLRPLLVAHAALANTRGPHGYGLVNGTAVPGEHLRVLALPPGPQEVSLASGGYPALRGTLAECEAHLAQLVAEDPLLISRFPYPRPVRPGHEGYADRAYVRVRVW